MMHLLPLIKTGTGLVFLDENKMRQLCVILQRENIHLTNDLD